MDSLFARCLVPTSFVDFPLRWKLINSRPEEFRGVSLIPGRVNMKIGHSRIISSSKRSTFQGCSFAVWSIRYEGMPFYMCKTVAPATQFNGEIKAVVALFTRCSTLSFLSFFMLGWNQWWDSILLAFAFLSLSVTHSLLYGDESLPSINLYTSDFQGFAKPLRLLLATEANIFTNYISEERFSLLELDKSTSLYMVEILTSKDFGSCLKDVNAAILLCLIDTDGDAVLQRISAVSWENTEQGKEMPFSQSIHFQRGSVDIFTFEGPKLGKIEALWVGLESGSWKLDGIRLTVIYGPLSLSKSTDDIKECKFDGFQYEFEANNTLLGEGGISVAELRPLLVTELHSSDLSTLLNSNSSPANSVLTHKTTNEESMREYSDLKLSLLLYDLVLSLSGSTILAFSLGEKAAFSFLFGGFGGFLYLLLLQKSVDGLSAPSSPSAALRGLKGPLLGLALALVMTSAAVKYGIGGSSMALAPRELFIGVAGFLACKIAVVLAAFKPIKRSLK